MTDKESIICNSPNLETTQKSINSRMNKTFIWMPLETTDTYNNMNESQKQFAEQNIHIQ